MWADCHEGVPGKSRAKGIIRSLQLVVFRLQWSLLTIWTVFFSKRQVLESAKISYGSEFVFCRAQPFSGVHSAELIEKNQNGYCRCTDDYPINSTARLTTLSSCCQALSDHYKESHHINAESVGEGEDFACWKLVSSQCPSSIFVAIGCSKKTDFVA